MDQTPTSLYEGLFLLNQQAVADLNGAIEHLREIFSRAKAEVVVMKKWGERRLAYEIKGQKRGVYILVYFNAQHDQLAHIERDCNLSEIVLRELVLRAEHIGETELELAKKDADLSLEVKLRSDLSNPVTAAASEAKPEAASPEPAQAAPVEAES
jgi:small subunit ribosomal protein S6